MKYEDSLRRKQDPAICPYSEPRQFNPHAPIPFFKI
jgi:hypothetical protein